MAERTNVVKCTLLGSILSNLLLLAAQSGGFATVQRVGIKYLAILFLSLGFVFLGVLPFGGAAWSLTQDSLSWRFGLVVWDLTPWLV